MSTPVRYPSGVTNVKPADACRNLPIPSLTRVNYFFDDFHWLQTVTTATDGTGSKWGQVTEAEGTIIQIDGDGGQIRLTGGSDLNEFVLLFTQNEIITMEAGKRLWFGIRAKIHTDLIETLVLMGLVEHDTDPLSVTDRDGCYFLSAGDAAELDIEMIGGSTGVASADNIATIDGSMHTYEFEFDGKTSVAYYVDGVHIGTISSASFPTTELGIAIAIAAFTSNAAIATCGSIDVDWVYAAKERVTVND